MKVLEIATKEIGTTESPRNSNLTKYGKWFSLDGVRWCGIFVSWCYFHAGRPLGNIGFKKGFAGCLTALIYFKKKGWITEDPQPGDIVFYDFDDNGRPEHCGLFENWINKTSFNAIEGNTGNKSQSNGGQVMSKIRDKIKDKAIFVHPIFSE